jgi:hypothetical protein
VCHCGDVVHAGGDLGLRCCGDSATIVTAVMGVDMFGSACYIITRLNPGLQHPDLAARHSTNIDGDGAEPATDNRPLPWPAGVEIRTCRTRRKQMPYQTRRPIATATSMYNMVPSQTGRLQPGRLACTFAMPVDSPMLHGRARCVQRVASRGRSATGSAARA